MIDSCQRLELRERHELDRAEVDAVAVAVAAGTEVDLQDHLEDIQDHQDLQDGLDHKEELDHLVPDRELQDLEEDDRIEQYLSEVGTGRVRHTAVLDVPEALENRFYPEDRSKEDLAVEDPVEEDLAEEDLAEEGLVVVDEEA